MISAKHVLGVALGLAIIGTVIAADDPIGERRGIMRKLSSAERAATSVILGKFRPDKAMASLKTIQELMVGFPSLFPVGSEAGGETKASPAIWAEIEAFESLAAKTIADAKGAEAAVAEGQDAFAMAWQVVATSCSSCHAEYAPTLMVR